MTRERARSAPRARADVTEHDGTVTVRYTIFGDRLDGTYLPSTTLTRT
jgi:hypothetical protein